MDIINITCAEIQTPVGFLYVILPVLLNHTNNPDCEQSWYLQPHFSHVTAFRVRNQTAVTPNSDDLNEVSPDLQHSDQLWWISALLIVVFLLGLICFLLRRRILRNLETTAIKARKRQAQNANMTPEMQCLDERAWLERLLSDLRVDVTPGQILEDNPGDTAITKNPGDHYGLST
ncbi:hypothetical protein ROHU_008309 [Labeo rohita]|uniref:Uncharacterized protein n=1 Tax=Labeo rohita TaxID=84645 RepID=A0A498MB97_LABRO|nr:hypothetical protein ROHU_008309 [Labeo rohita]